MSNDERRLRAWAYLSRVAEAPFAELAELVARVGPIEAAERVRGGAVEPEVGRRTEARRDIDCAAEDLELLKRRDGRLVTRDDDEWPALAFTAFAGAPVRDKPQGRAPLALWVIGPLRLDEVAERAAAIVGTRACTAYGEHVAADLSAGLAENDVAIVSGGAICSLACRSVVDDMVVVIVRPCEQRFCRVSGWFSATNRTLCGILALGTNCWSQIETA